MVTKEVITISSEESIIHARTRVRNFIEKLNIQFTALERMHILTVVSELSRNIYLYAKEGQVVCEKITNPRTGVRLEFIDSGPGIEDIEHAMQPKPVTKYQVGMGLGLMGSKRLADEFDINTAPGYGTRITYIKWSS
jgi:serine/threonine-protein kinase RsbT